jgi:hypothetical protein
MRFEPYPSLGERANVIVDGAANAHTALVLSHWPKSGTSKEWLADTSAEIVFRWLDGKQSVHAELASNDHFDEDGLVALFAITHPDEAQARRRRLIEIASAGDFAVSDDRDAVRAALTIAAFAEEGTSPLPSSTFRGTYPETTAALYAELLPRLAEIADAPETFRTMWREEDARIDEDIRAIASGDVRIEEIDDLDLAVVTLPGSAREEKIHRFAGARRASLHPVALHASTRRTCLLITRGRTHEVQYRYETWVQFVSRRPRARRDLAPLSAALTEKERHGGRWTFDGIGRITPRLHLESASDGANDGAFESDVDAAELRATLVDFLRAHPAGWDPYGA